MNRHPLPLPLPPLNNRKGFTLVELMVVVAIIAIMGSFGYSGFTNWQERERIRSAAFQLAGHLKEARLKAMEKQFSHALILNDTADTYRICQDTSPHDDCDAGGVLYNVSMTRIYQNVTFTVTGLTVNGSGQPYLRFDGRGVPRDTGSALSGGQITFSSTEYPNCDCVVVISGIGRIQVNEGSCYF